MIYRHMSIAGFRQLFCAMLLALCAMPVVAQKQPAANDSVKVFTEDHPLVYEDAWDLWPYAFLNEAGEPVGFNIDAYRGIFQDSSMISCISSSMLSLFSISSLFIISFQPLSVWRFCFVGSAAAPRR